MVGSLVSSRPAESMKANFRLLAPSLGVTPVIDVDWKEEFGYPERAFP